MTSQEGRGTTFTVTIRTGTSHLPPERIGAARQPPRRASAPSRTSKRRFAGCPRPDASTATADADLDDSRDARSIRRATPPRVLVADDNADMRDYLGRILGQHYRVEVVGDGSAALDANSPSRSRSRARRRDDADARWVWPADGDPRRRTDPFAPGDSALGAGRRRGAHRRSARRRRRVSRQAVQRARTAGLRRLAAQAGAAAARDRAGPALSQRAVSDAPEPGAARRLRRGRGLPHSRREPCRAPGLRRHSRRRDRPRFRRDRCISSGNGLRG